MVRPDQDQAPLGSMPQRYANRALNSLRRLARMSGLGPVAARLNPAALKTVLNLRGVLSADSDAITDASATPTAPAVPEPAAEPSAHHQPTVIQLAAQDAHWLKVSWQLSATAADLLNSAAGSSLALRLMPVTEASAHGGIIPMARLEVVVDSGSTAWWLPVPVSGAAYRIELGLRQAGGFWQSLAISEAVMVPVAAEDPLPLASGSLGDLETMATPIATAGSTAGVDHERLYQLATSASPRRRRVGSELLHEQSRSQALQQQQGAETALHASGAGFWASGRSASGMGLSGAGIQPRQLSFWLVADAQVIVHGATDATAQLQIGAERIDLEADGTFHIQVPFPDGEQRYPIEATAADGVQKRWKHLDFRRSTPQAQVNRREDAIAEWF
jgi:hypothetical protein